MNLLLLLQTLAIFVLPWLLGRALFLLTNRDQAESVLFAFVLGSLSLFTTVMGLRFVFGLSGVAFVQWFFSGVWVATLLSAVVNLYHKPVVRLTSWLPAAVILGGAALVYGLWTWQSPYPLNWDLYQHQQLARLIGQGKIHYFTTEMSDTFGFNSYPPFFHVLLAISQYPFVLRPVELLTYWQLLSYWQLVLVAVAAYHLMQAVTAKRSAGIFAALMSMLIFDSQTSLTTFFMMPQTIAAVLFILLLAKLLQTWDKTSVMELVLGAVALVLMHYLVGGVGALVYLGVALYSKVTSRLTGWGQRVPWSLLLAALGVAAVATMMRLPLAELNQGEGAAYSLDVTTTLQVVERGFAYFAYALVPFGMFALWRSKLAWHKKEMVSLLFFGFGLVLFSGLPYALKLMSIWRFFLIVLIGLGVTLWWDKLRLVGTKVLFVLLLLVALGVNLLTNLIVFRSGIMAEGMYTHVAQADIDAATWLQANYGSDAMLLSDPGTQFILEGLSGVDSLAGAYMPLAQREVLWPALYHQQPAKLVAANRQLTAESQATKRLLVVSGRSFAWARANDEQWQSFTYNVWSPIAFSSNDKQVLAAITRQSGVKLMYQNTHIAIWEIENGN